MKLSRLLVLAAPVSVLAVSAQAGGYTSPVVEAVAPVVETVAPVGDWQGGYAGITLGYGFKGEDRVGLGPATSTPGADNSVTNIDKLDLGGVNAGLRVGYRWQNNNWVFGPELAFEGGNVKDSFNTDGYEASSKVKNVLSLRAKVGYAVQPDLLVYGMAGAARGKIDYKVEGTGAAGTAAIDDTYTRTGYVVGLGVEKKISDRMFAAARS